MEGRPQGTIAFLFSDVEGSTRLWEEQSLAMDRALIAHDRILREAIEAESGYVFSTQGDAFAAAFHSASDAARAALAIQHSLTHHSWPDDARIQVRIGLHVGEAHERDDDYFGPTLNRTARIMSAAHGGQTVCSSAVASLIDVEPLTDLGEHRLKDLSAPERMWQLGLGEHPPLDTLDQRRHNLPVGRTQLVGRDEEIVELADRIAANRLVSVLGLGGTGKTRVAVAAAAHVVEDYPDGVWFVDLVPASDAAGVAEAVAGAAGYRIGGADLGASLAEVLEGRRALFVLDNCEHLTVAVADLLDSLLSSTNGPHFLATSREPLGLLDEYQFTLDPLPVSADASSPAIELFTSTAARVGAQLTSSELPDVASVCAHLDGHPLSIELAAAQLRQLTVGQLASRLTDRFELLARGRASNRQASLLAVLEDTWDMVEPEGQHLLVQLAAFPSSFGLEEIEEVAADLGAGVVGRTLAGLIERNLVVGDGVGGYRLLETVKLFAQRRVGAAEASERHALWVLDRLRAVPEDRWWSSMSHAGWILHHADDVRAVEDRLAEQQRWPELGALFETMGCYVHNGIGGARAAGLIQRVEEYLDRVPPDDHPTLLTLHLVAGYAGLAARRPDWIRRGGERSVELSAATGGAVERAVALTLNAWLVGLHDPGSSIVTLQEAFDVAESAGESGVANVALAYEAVNEGLAGNVDVAHVLLDELERRLATTDPERDQSAWFLAQTLRISITVVADPDRARRTSEGWVDHYFETTVGLGVLDTSAVAGVRDVAGTRWRMEEAIRQWDDSGADDGFPDWLIPLASLALAVGDVDRCRTLVTTIRRSPVPTHNFLHTIIYRQLRDRVGLAETNPLDSRTIEEIFDDAMEWMASLEEPG